MTMSGDIFGLIYARIILAISVVVDIVSECAFVCLGQANETNEK